MISPHLSPDTLAFLAELVENNNTAWFQANRNRYEQHVKKPFEAVVAAVQDELRALDPTLPLAKPGQLIFRINRDIRFSKDKSPYKTNIAAYFCAGGRKSSLPGFYFEVRADRLWCGGGLYELGTEELRRVRQEIRYNLPEFAALVADPAFVGHYGQMLGERNKTLPADMREDAALQPLLYNKQFYFAHTYEPAITTTPALVPSLVESYRIAQPLIGFLARAITPTE